MFYVPKPCPVPKVARVRLKLCMVGEREVGKTSLVQRYVHNRFPQALPGPRDIRLHHRPLVLELPDRGLQVRANLVIWDVPGDRLSDQVHRRLCLHGAHGIIAVADAARRETLGAALAWTEGLSTYSPWAKLHIVVNKWDHPDRTLDYPDLEPHGLPLLRPPMPASARTGANVEEAFRAVVEGVVRGYLERQPRKPTGPQ